MAVYPATRERGIGSLFPALLFGVFALQGVKLWLAASLPLFGDEAFYWLESRHLAVAYDDVPALTPWLIALGEALFGRHDLALRAPFLLMSWLSLFVLWQIARDLGGRRVATVALVLACLPPLLAMNGVMALPDVGLNLAVLLCLRGLQRLDGGHPWAGLWLATGLTLGSLGHYRFALPLALAAVVLLATRNGRRLLAMPGVKPWALGGLALGLAPLAWHELGGGGGLAFHFRDRHAWQFQAEPLLDPLLQALAVSPVLYALLLWAGCKTVQQGGAALPRLLAWLGLGLVALYLLLGPFADAERSRLHWPVPAYLALIPLLALRWHSLHRAWRGAAVALGLVVGIGGAGYLAAVAIAPSRLADSDLYPHNFAGWSEIAEWLAPRLGAGEAVVVADHFTLAAQLQRRLGDRARVFSLDHPLNRKHGRQLELARQRRDEQALAAVNVPRWFVFELSASRLRERAAWLQRFCARYPQARWVGERLIAGGRKRAVYFREETGAGVCSGPALVYLDSPRAGAVVHGGEAIGGWALAAGLGVDALRLRLDGRVIALPQRHALPSLADRLGNTGDPRFPEVGFAGTLPAGLRPGHHRLQVEANVAGRDWQVVESIPIRVGSP